MQAIVQSAYGPPEQVLSLREVETPETGEGELLLRVKAASIHPDIWHVVNGYPSVLRLMGAGLARPRQPIPGTDVAGVVESVGVGVTRFRPGDRVFGESIRGHQWKNGGAFAEFVAVPQDSLALIPEGISFEQAAAVVTSGLIALNNLRGETAIRAGQNVLINGAAGGVGSIALQFAKASGARVTGVDHSRKQEMMRRLGADHVIDHTREDVLQGDARYDLIVDVASTLSHTDCKRILAPGGLYLVIGHDHYGTRSGRLMGSLPRFFLMMLVSLFASHLPRPNFDLPSRQELMPVLRDLLAREQLTPVIDRVYPLSETVDALHYLESGETCGKIIVSP
jgi:NADPH:quinone reductase-like Zn-dependent oxidoreductase